jgi:hypothetical protein
MTTSQPDEGRSLTDDMDAIRDRTEADFVTAPDTVTGPLAVELMQARTDRAVLLVELDRLLAENAALAADQNGRVRETAAAVARSANAQIRALEQRLSDEQQRSLSLQGRCETAEREAKHLRAGRDRAIENCMTLSERVDEITAAYETRLAKETTR